MDLDRFSKITIDHLLELSQYQRAMRGNVKNLEKKSSVDVSATQIHSAKTEMDVFIQDHLMLPLLSTFPMLVPLVEEDTIMKRLYAHNKSEWALLIDPIDGTLEYCNGGKKYSTMVGLLKNGHMVVGIGYYPEQDDLYESGATTALFEYNGKDDTTSWSTRRATFGNPDPVRSIPRYRVVVARDSRTLSWILSDIQNIPSGIHGGNDCG